MDHRPNTSNPASTAKVAGHPIHPMLVVFPIAFFVGTFLSDLAYWIDGDAGFAQASVWLLGLGIVMALLAALAGFADFLGDSRVRRLGDAWQHMVGNLVAVALAAAGLIVRLEAGAEAGVIPVGLLLSTAVVVVLLYTGWKGGELVYRHRVGVQPQQPMFAERHVDGPTAETPVEPAPIGGTAPPRDEPRPRPH